MEPEILRRGKAFHKRVQEDWEKTAEGKINREHVIKLTLVPGGARHKKVGRLDLFVDEIGDSVSIVEIKSTDWDQIKEKNRKKLLASHRRQVWRYIDEYIDVKNISVCPGIIYPKSPKIPGLKHLIESYLNDYGLQVVWYDEPVRNG